MDQSLTCSLPILRSVAACHWLIFHNHYFTILFQFFKTIDRFFFLHYLTFNLCKVAGDNFTALGPLGLQNAQPINLQRSTVNNNVLSN